MEDKEDKVIEGEDYRGKEVFSFRELFLIQVRRCMDAGSKEMREGFWVYSQNPNMISQKVKYVGDAREEYTNAVISLVDLTQTRFDKTAKDKINKLYEKATTERKDNYEEYKKTDVNKEKIAKNWNKRKVEIYREIFREVCNFGERKKWFEVKGGGE